MLIWFPWTGYDNKRVTFDLNCHNLIIILCWEKIFFTESPFRFKTKGWWHQDTLLYERNLCINYFPASLLVMFCGDMESHNFQLMILQVVLKGNGLKSPQRVPSCMFKDIIIKKKKEKKRISFWIIVCHRYGYSFTVVERAQHTAIQRHTFRIASELRKRLHQSDNTCAAFRKRDANTLTRVLSFLGHRINYLL